VDEHDFDTLNVVPFIDVMLVLLVMVLTTATFVVTGRIPVSLPQASSSRVERKADKTIELGRDGALALDGEMMSLTEMAARLAHLPRETSFLLRLDRELAVQRFVDVADLLKRSGFSRVAIQTQMTGHAATSGMTTSGAASGVAVPGATASGVTPSGPAAPGVATSGATASEVSPP
jgi:biopolymer transport protein ExbD